MRTHGRLTSRVPEASDGSTTVVSGKAISFTIRCIRLSSIPSAAACMRMGCGKAIGDLLRPRRTDAVRARVGNRLSEVLVLVFEQIADCVFLCHITAK